MNLIYVSFSLTPFSISDTNTFDKYYADVLKPLIKFLNKNPDFHFSFAFTGPELLFLKKKKSEFLKVLNELVKRGQCEIYGGGFFAPVLPLLLPSDRNGQIEMLSSEIRHATGKSPRGLCLFNDIWDPSLLQTMKSCSMDYVFLDESNIPLEKRKFLPVYMSDLGKSKDIYYISRDLKNDILSFVNKDSEIQVNNQSENTSVFASSEDVSAFLKKLQKKVSKINEVSSLISSDHKNIVNISFDPVELKLLLSRNFFSIFQSEIKNFQDNSQFILSTVSEFSKQSIIKENAYISSGLLPVLSSITEKSYIKNESEKNVKNYTVFDFFQTYPRCCSLNNRIFYVSQLVNQPCKDKAFQNAAKEKLWEAQNSNGILCPYLSTKKRQEYYKKLMEAENLLCGVAEKKGTSKESVLCFDYNNDGYNEYILRMKDYFSYISLKGGSVHEFQSVKNTANYTDNFSREEAFDGVNDGYNRGFFVDHIFTPEQFQKYVNKEIAGDGIFSRVLYEEVKFSTKHNELILKASASVKGQNISIIKKYLINSSGMNIQYIIKNESDSRFTSRLCVENNFAHIDFTKENPGDYKVLLATETEALEIDSEKSSKDCFEKGYLENINVVQITDDSNGISFSFEPNENCSYCFYPLKFKRPDYMTGEMIDLAMTYVSSLVWDLDIESGKETEKNFNFTIFNSHKSYKKK